MEQRRYPWGLIAVVTGGGLYFLYHFRQPLIPFVLSFALAYLVNPVVNVFTVRGYRREYIVAILYTLIGITISLAANFLLPSVAKQLSSLQGQAPELLARTQETWAHFEDELAQRMPIGGNLVRHWSFQMYDPLIGQLQHLPSYLLDIFPLLSLLFLVPFISFYLLMDSAHLTHKAIQACPSRHVEQILHLISEVDTSLGNYVRGVLLESLAVAAASYVCMWCMNVNYSLAIALIAGVSNVVPYGGPLLGAATGGLVALVQFRNFWMVGKVLLVFAAIRAADDIFLQPVISRFSIHLHPLIYLLALMVGAEAFGFIGLLLGVPAACIVKSLIRVFWEWHVTESRIIPPNAPGAIRVPYV